MRVVETWMDGYWKDRFYIASGFRAGSVQYGSLAEARRLQQRLKCKSFEWYARKFRGRAPVDKSP